VTAEVAGSPNRYRIQGASFAIGPQLTDDTINIFTGRAPDFDKTSLVITRAYVDDLDIDKYSSEQLDKVRNNFHDFSLFTTRDIRVCDRTCREVMFSWRGDPGLIHQWQLYMPFGPSILIVTFSAINQVNGVHRGFLKRFVESIQLD
jgi:hypothetical protein